MPQDSIQAKTITGQTLTFPIKEPRLLYGVIITPEVATFLLEYAKDKFNNRQMSQDRINEYGGDMLAGRWKHNGETLKTGLAGVLVDGFTRCASAFNFSTSFITDIRTGVEDEAVATIDTGRPRSLGNALLMSGVAEKAPTALAQGVSWLHKYTHCQTAGNIRRLSSGEAIQFLKQHPGLHDSVDATSSCRNKRIASPGVLVASHYICSKANAKRAEEFFDMLSTGVGYSQTSPVRHLRERLISRTERRYKPAEQLGWILHAWNKFIAGEQMRILKLPNDMPVVKGFTRKQEKLEAQTGKLAS